MAKTPRKIARKLSPHVRIAPEDRILIPSLREYLRAVSRAAPRGEREDEQTRFAKRCGTSANYLVQLYLGVRKARAETALNIEQASYGMVRAEDICPEFDWQYAKLRALKPAERAQALATIELSSEHIDHHADLAHHA